MGIEYNKELYDAKSTDFWEYFLRAINTEEENRQLKAQIEYLLLKQDKEMDIKLSELIDEVNNGGNNNGRAI